jgi:hypothetical protein
MHVIKLAQGVAGGEHGRGRKALNVKQLVERRLAVNSQLFIVHLSLYPHPYARNKIANLVTVNTAENEHLLDL